MEISDITASILIIHQHRNVEQFLKLAKKQNLFQIAKPDMATNAIVGTLGKVKKIGQKALTKVKGILDEATSGLREGSTDTRARLELKSASFKSTPASKPAAASKQPARAVTAKKRAMAPNKSSKPVSRRKASPAKGTGNLR